MMTGLANTKKGLLLFVGLSKTNVERLQKGLPIHLRQDTHAMPPNLDAIIFYGETELEMKRMLERQGLITEETKQTIDPRLK